MVPAPFINMKIYKEPNNLLGVHWPGHSLFIDIDDRWQKTENIEQCDLIPLIYHDDELLIKQKEILKNKIKQHHKILLLHYFHIDDYYTPEYYEDVRLKYTDITEQVYIVHKNYKNNLDKHIYFDHMFNRQKLYCTDWKDDLELDNRTWTWGANQEIYKINDIVKTSKFKFMAPNRIYGDLERPRMKTRIGINFFLHKHFSSQGLINDPVQGNIFYPNGVDQSSDTTQVSRPGGEGGTWYPIGDRYYADTFLSIYTESITVGTAVDFVSEKTFDPLIKGNYILPFGYCGMIEFMKSKYEITLPDWIDYTYDNIQDDKLRFERYLHSVANVLGNSIDYIQQKYKDDKEIINKNKNLFYNRNYDYLYDVCKERIS